LNPAGSAFVYSTYLGGSSFDEGASIAVDASGSAYVTGRTGSTDFPTTPGAFQGVQPGVAVFVAKIAQPACTTTVTVVANFTQKGSSTAKKVPVADAEVVMLPKSSVQAYCNLLDAQCVWTNLTAINTGTMGVPDPVVTTNTNGQAVVTSSVQDPNGWAIYPDLYGADVGTTAPAITQGTTQIAVANTDCAPEKQFQVILTTDGGTTTAMSQRQQRITESVLEITYPESVQWDGTEFLYPFIFASDSDWQVDVCASVPQGYRIVGSPCVQLFVANETKVIFFDVIDVGSPEPHLQVRGNVRHKGKTQPLSLNVPGLRKKQR
jgi:hypothetical protein